MGNQLAHGIVGIDDGGNGGVEDHLGLGIDLNHALLDALVVADHALHAMAFDAKQIGGQQDILDDVSFLLGKAELLECFHAEAMEGFITPILICHVIIPHFSPAPRRGVN